MGKQIKKLRELNNKTRGNVFIGLIHAKLLPEVRTSRISSSNPFYKIYAVPSTTIFIRVSNRLINKICYLVDEVKKVKQQQKNVKDEDIKVHLYLNDILCSDYVEATFPECLTSEDYITYLPRDNICKTCCAISSCYCYRIPSHAIICLYVIAIA